MHSKHHRAIKRPATLLAAIAIATGASITGPAAGSASAATQCSVSGATGASSTRAFTPTGITAGDSTDDRAGVQAAIDRAGAAGGGVVVLPAGTLVTNGPIRLRSGVALKGQGAATRVKAGPSFLGRTGPRGGHPLITTDGARNVTIADLTADQSGDTLNGNVAGRLTEYLVDVRDSTNAVVDGVHTRNPFTYSIAAAGSTRFCIKDSSTQSATNGRYDQLDGIHVLNSSFGDVVGNTVDQRLGTDGDDGLVAHTINGSVHDVAYVDNRVRGGRHGSAMQLAYTSASDRIYNLRIQGNEFWGSPRGVRTGTYGTAGRADSIVIGGAAGAGNTFRDNGGNAVDLSGSLSSITVTHNSACNSGGFKVGTGAGNTVAGNTTTC